jgi:hypothetical protein
LEFFSTISWGVSTGSKDEFRIFEEKKIKFSLLAPVLNPKISSFSPLEPVQSPQEIEEKNWVIVPVQIAYFWT